MSKDNSKVSVNSKTVIGFNCKACKEADSIDDMVECEVCKNWFHFCCVGVTSEIQNKHWQCNGCVKQSEIKDANTIRTRSSRKSIDLELHKLEFEHNLQQKRLQEALQRESTRIAELDREYIEKRFSVLQTANEDGVKSQSISSIASFAHQGPTLINRNMKSENLNNQNVNNSNILNQDLRNPQSGNANVRNFNYVNANINPYNGNIRNIPDITTVSAEQLAARQAISKELPIFDGNPEDWPLFISRFETSTRICGLTDDENLMRLCKCLKGQAMEAVRARLLLPSNVTGIISTLKRLFGNPNAIINSLISKIKDETPVKMEKLETIVSFSLKVENLCATMQASNLKDHLKNPILLKELVDKLPPQLKLDWARHTVNFEDTNIQVFNSWLLDLSESLTDITVYTPVTNDQRSSKKKTYVNAHSSSPDHVDDNSRNEKRCLVCQQLCSSIKDCNKFKNFSLKERWDAVKQHKLCRTCLNAHGNAKCRFYNICGKDNCTFKHHQLLHNNNIRSDANINDNNQFSGTIQENNNSTILFRIIPVTLYGDEKHIETFAFFDDGSSLTLMEDKLADELGLKGKPEPLCLRWTANTHREEKDSKCVNLEVSGKNNKKKRYNIENVRTVKSLNLPKQSLNQDELSLKFSHLKNLPIESYEQAVPRILVGLDNWSLGAPLKSKEGRINEPIAVKTRLGWNVYGRCENNFCSNIESKHEFNGFHLCDCQKANDENLQEIVKEYILLDNLGVEREQKNLVSPEDQRCIRILEDTTIRKENRFETGLLWKYEDFKLPNSLPVAKRRLQGLESRMSREPNLKSVLQQKITNYEEQGYIRKLSKKELQITHPRTWYLPIFPVVNPNKPSKIRIVWDAAAKVNGISLNSMLLKGPDQLASLLSVLYQFRERKIAICADIKEMFHQVRIREVDQHSQRFLWRNDPNKEPDVYLMKVMTFGASCSPSCAQYIKNKNATEFQHIFPRAVKSIINNHYVDDLLDSVDEEEEAIKLAQDIKYIHRKGGFEIRNFISNSTKVSNALNEVTNEVKESLNMNIQAESEKVLGMWWSTSTDTFNYSLQQDQNNKDILSGSRKPTKREVLRILMKMFDPMGLIANFLVYAKILLQEIWKSSVKWDDEISEVHYKKWLTWIRLLKQIKNIRIPRCYVSSSETPKEYQLHVLVDASEHAYAAVACLKIITAEKQECALIGAKTKVAPLKLLSIPRLELQAALLGSRLAASICSHHSIKINRRVLWSDSRTVLSWLNSDHRSYKQFVAFRISEILENTSVQEWRWVPTKLNVADEATKWSKFPDLSSTSKWFTGPHFLYLSEENWPKNVSPIKTTDEEIRPHLLHNFVPSRCIIEVQRFSNWYRLLRAVAFIFRFINNTQKKNCKLLGPISQQEYQRAENYLYQQTQNDCYADEIAILTKNKKLPPGEKLKIEKCSTISKQSPYIDENNVVRIQGRIDAAVGVSEITKRPILLPKDHHITKLVILSYHRRYHHYNHETVVNELRQKFSISQLRVALKKIRRSCQTCKNLSAKPKPPEMAALPAARLTPFTRAFTYVGIDYFGPITVSLGRRSEKRWGALITCLCTRAVHIEVAHSLSTSSCIICIRNFMARRGTPNEIYSDNGTNFHGAERELQEAIKLINKNKLAEAFTSSLTKWVFIPPASPHMGGSWERLVQSTKKVLYQIMPTRHPTDEMLYSMLLEVENIINSRPLTYIPLDDENEEALTPNQFLLGSSSGVKPVGEFTDERLALKRSWLAVQLYADKFWKRWVKEYLPTLTRRTKWFDQVKPIEPGDIVVIIDENNPRNYWPKGKVLEVTCNQGQVRRAVVQTSTGIYERPAVKLAVLDVKVNEGTPKQAYRYTGGECQKPCDI